MVIAKEETVPVVDPIFESILDKVVFPAVWAEAVAKVERAVNILDKVELSPPSVVTREFRAVNMEASVVFPAVWLVAVETFAKEVLIASKSAISVA